MTVFGAVFARGGSKGLPGKNLRHVGGISLLERAINAARDAESIQSVIVSTDDEVITKEAIRLGAEVPFRRPAEFSHDDSPEWGAWQHLAQYLLERGALGSDLFVSIPPTAPLRLPADIDSAVRELKAGCFDVVLAVSESTRSPWFNMVKRAPDGIVEVALPQVGDPVFRRQDAPSLFDITTVVYASTLGYINSADRMLEGVVGSITVPPGRAIDIDTETDLLIADCLARKSID